MGRNYILCVIWGLVIGQIGVVLGENNLMKGAENANKEG